MTLWFDFISPYAFLAWLDVGGLAARHEVELILQPTLFAALLDHHGQLGPAEIPAKRAYTFRDVARLAAHRGLSLRGPATHPFSPLTALRCSLREVAGADQVRVIDALFHAIWVDGIDAGDPTRIAAALDARGLDGTSLVARTRNPEVKEALRAGTERAIARGVFGVPMVEVDGELFWGHDRLPMAELRLQGRDPLPDDADAARLQSLPAGAVRPGAARPSRAG
ncbi:MAG: 2-hydroxychromene-2-carboxylate isomerase [Alphaproteobacteria bacterium]|nr:2-hydroxychromene-2-carboxylate isomerase [Alphaproteobacteria bacterium]MCB9698486.1 2-hydroxychromene-2-carboxylate isomerase [Alphaproteobacteria bacterium]